MHDLSASLQDVRVRVILRLANKVGLVVKYEDILKLINMNDFDIFNAIEDANKNPWYKILNKFSKFLNISWR